MWEPVSYTHLDVYKRQEQIIKDIQKYLRVNLPVIPVANTEQVLGIRSNVKGFVPTPAGSHFFQNVHFENAEQ